MIAAKIEEEDIRAGENQVLHGANGGGRRRVRVKEIAADQDSRGVLLLSIETEPPECAQQLCSSLRGPGRVKFCSKIRIQMQIAAMNDLHYYLHVEALCAETARRISRRRILRCDLQGLRRSDSNLVSEKTAHQSDFSLFFLCFKDQLVEQGDGMRIAHDHGIEIVLALADHCAGDIVVEESTDCGIAKHSSDPVLVPPAGV